MGQPLTGRLYPSDLTDHAGSHDQESFMLLTLAIILIILWLLGLITSYTLGGWLHILLVVAVIVLLVRLIAGRPGPPVPPAY